MCRLHTWHTFTKWPQSQLQESLSSQLQCRLINKKLLSVWRFWEQQRFVSTHSNAWYYFLNWPLPSKAFHGLSKLLQMDKQTNKNRRSLGIPMGSETDQLIIHRSSEAVVGYNENSCKYLGCSMSHHYYHHFFYHHWLFNTQWFDKCRNAQISYGTM